MDRPVDRQIREMTWSEYGKLEALLVSAVKDFMDMNDIDKIDAVIGIWRGGVVLTRSMASKMGELPMIVVNPECDVKDPSSIMCDEAINEIKGKKAGNKTALLVDDISDSGNTFARMKDLVETRYFGKVITAALILKQDSSFYPDMYASLDQSRDWIQFPWE